MDLGEVHYPCNRILAIVFGQKAIVDVTEED
jgi:hypothetical protein